MCGASLCLCRWKNAGSGRIGLKISEKTLQMRSAQTLTCLGYYEKIIKYIVTNCLAF